VHFVPGSHSSVPATLAVRASALQMLPSRTGGTHIPPNADWIRAGRGNAASNARQYVPEEHLGPLGPGVQPMSGVALVARHVPTVVDVPFGTQA
jgi:hypothetical protein